MINNNNFADNYFELRTYKIQKPKKTIIKNHNTTTISTIAATTSTTNNHININNNSSSNNCIRVETKGLKKYNYLPGATTIVPSPSSTTSISSSNDGSSTGCNNCLGNVDNVLQVIPIVSPTTMMTVRLPYSRSSHQQPFNNYNYNNTYNNNNVIIDNNNNNSSSSDNWNNCSNYTNAISCLKEENESQLLPQLANNMNTLPSIHQLLNNNELRYERSNNNSIQKQPSSPSINYNNYDHVNNHYHHTTYEARPIFNTNMNNVTNNSDKIRTIHNYHHQQPLTNNNNHYYRNVN
ncbi:hypothetical protein ABK040_007301 [Willaertia magna]